MNQKETINICFS